MAQILQYGFTHDFGSAVHTVGFEWSCFGNRDNGRCAINCRRGGIHELVAVVLSHYLRKENGGRNVVLVVCERDFRGFSNSFVGLKERAASVRRFDASGAITNRDVNHTPNATFPVLLKYPPYIFVLRKVPRESIHFRAVAILLSGIRRQLVARDLRCAL